MRRKVHRGEAGIDPGPAAPSYDLYSFYGVVAEACVSYVAGLGKIHKEGVKLTQDNTVVDMV